MKMDYETKLVVFSCTTIMFLCVYSVNLLTGLTIVSRGMKVLHPSLFFLSLISTMSSALTVVASMDWLIFAQFMHINTNSNLLWVLHHITASILTFFLHLYLLYEIKQLKSDRFNRGLLFPINSLKNVLS